MLSSTKYLRKPTLNKRIFGIILNSFKWCISSVFGKWEDLFKGACRGRWLPRRPAVNISSPGHQPKPALLTSSQKPSVLLSLGKDMNHLWVCGDMKTSGSITYKLLSYTLLGTSEVHTNTNIFLSVYKNTSPEKPGHFNLKNKFTSYTNYLKISSDFTSSLLPLPPFLPFVNNFSCLVKSLEEDTKLNKKPLSSVFFQSIDDHWNFGEK